MAKLLKKIPQFKSEAQERKFWQNHDSTEYLDWSKAERGHFPNLKATSHAISIRIPDYIISRVKERAHALDVPYQALIKQYIARGIEQKR